MTKQTVLPSLRALRPAHGGTCFALHPDGRPVFIRHTLPGEVVDATVTKERSRLLHADATTIIHASEHRQPHVWPQAGPGGVGGADLGHVKPEYQRIWKTDVIADQLSRIGGTPTFEAVKEALGTTALKVEPASGDETGDLRHRRTRVEFEITKNRRLAMTRVDSHDLVEIDDMPLADQSLLDLELLGDSPWKRLYRPGKRVRAIAPNAGGRRIVIGNQTFNSRRRRVRDIATWSVDYRGLTAQFDVNTHGFWQTHRSAPSDLVGTVMDFAQVRPGDGVLELFSGAGLFSYFLAHAVGEHGRFISLEGSRMAVSDARHNLRSLDTPRDLQVGQINSQTIMQAWSDLEQRPDLIVLDPPRSGAGKEILTTIGMIGPERVILVSCDPAAGARDIRDLMARGYAVTNLRAIDLFPQTHHFEIVTVFSRQ
ncbi:MAG: TRAM domain-containing protein [Actinomycetaceae bacterium]|nr:TRAM domain-containing protein [Actinomycetaceae bacterium]